MSVNIVMYNLSGLYMGPVAQIAAMLALPINDNFKTSKTLERALRLMNNELDSMETLSDDDHSYDQTGPSPHYWVAAEPEQTPFDMDTKSSEKGDLEKGKGSKNVFSLYLKPLQPNDFDEQ